MTTPGDHVLLPVQDVHVAVGIDPGDVAGAEPPVLDGGRGRRLITEVTRCHQRPAQQELSGLPGLERSALVVDQASLHARKRSPDRARFEGELVIEQHRRGRVRLGQPIDVQKSDPGQAGPELGDGARREGGSTEAEPAQMGDGLGPKRGVAQQEQPHRRHGVGPRDALLGQRAEVGGRPRSGDQGATAPDESHRQ